jgi:hypothetical protein
MQLARASKVVGTGLLALIALVTASPLPFAMGRDCCRPSPQVFQSEFFGYYRTCWRPWQGGQPTCPNAPPPPRPRSAPKKGTEGLELLPMPKPEEGA